MQAPLVNIIGKNIRIQGLLGVSSHVRCHSTGVFSPFCRPPLQVAFNFCTPEEAPYKSQLLARNAWFQSSLDNIFPLGTKCIDFCSLQSLYFHFFFICIDEHPIKVFFLPIL
jgi:hypothetical protein